MNNKKIYRTKNDFILAGVCGGLADYFEIDVVLIRIIFVFLAVIGGGGALIYLILWLMIPEKKISDDISKKIITTKELKKEIVVEKEQGSFFGLFLVLFGGVLLVDKLFPMIIRWNYFWPVMLMFWGGYLMLRK